MNTTKPNLALTAVLVVLLTLSACVAVPMPSATQVISKEALRNATYSGIYDGPITLIKGLYEGIPGEGDPAKPIVQYDDGSELFGDLDRDGVQDAVVFLVERGGGSGAFTYVAAQLSRGGKPVDAGAVRIEDRIGVKSAAIKDGQVVMEIITQGPGDVACCSSHKAHKTYAVQDGRFAEVASDTKDLVKVSAADLNGAQWILVEISEGQPTLADTEVTANFQDGRIGGSGGCNSYNANFVLDDVNPFAVTTGPSVATQKSCADPILKQEAAYLAALGRVSQWNYVYGRLALYYKDDSGKLNRLLFAPAAK